MKDIAPYQIATLIIVSLLTNGCAYIDHIQQNANYRNIENSISISNLESAEKFIGKAPLSRAYEFSFTNARDESFSLLFTLHENSFSQSTLKFRRDDEFLRDASRIDENKRILLALKNHLPQTNQVSWIIVGELPKDEAMDYYSVMLEYIRYKIRDS